MLDLLGVGELFGQASMLSGLPTGFTARAERGHGLLPHPGRRRPRAARPARGAAVRLALAAGPRAPAPAARTSVPRATPAPRTSPSPRSCAGRWSSARRRPAIRDAAQRMTRPGATCAVVDLGEVARDPHRSRPAHARGGRRAVRRRARLGGDDGAGLHGRGRPAGQRGVAGHARPRRPPLPRRCRRPARCSASSRTPTWSAAETRSSFHLRAAIARATTTDELVARGARPAPDDRRAAPRADGAAAPRRRSTRWSSTRSSGG